MEKYSISQISINKNNEYIAWKNFLSKSFGKTIFHNPDFLAYHKSKFSEHHLAIYKGNELFGIIPLAFISNGKNKIAKSPYGGSFGGFIFNRKLTYSDSQKIITLFINYLKELYVTEIIITPPLRIYYDDEYCETFNFAMLEQGFKIINSDIVSIISLKESNIEANIFTSDARRMIKKAKSFNIIIEKKGSFNDFWNLMEKTFKRHGTKPTHSYEEWKWLCENIPESVCNSIAYFENKPIAGIGHFVQNEFVCSPFYFCMDQNYKQTQALSLLVKEDILNAKERGFKWYDIGTSSYNMNGRANIFMFKESFGAFGTFRHTFKWQNYK